MKQYEKDHIARLRPYLAECTVLLRKNGAFPLEAPCRIAAVGAGVRKTIKGGTGSGEVNSRYFVNIEDGLKAAGFEVMSGGWSDAYEIYENAARKEFVEEIKAKAKKENINAIAASMGAVMRQPEYEIALAYNCDAAIYVVSRISGEGNDRLNEKGDYALTDSEVRDILALDEAYDKFMLVINAGGPVDLTPVMSVGNILVLSQLGVETGAALADILLGRAYPSGKLATTWASADSCCSVGTFGDIDDTYYTEGIYVGYRWFDSARIEPLFPFGWGLGYTDFALEAGDVTVDGPEVRVSIRVTNTGSFIGKEAPQVYVSCPSERMDREVKTLAGFAKTGELAPGESENVTISFDMKDLAAYDESIHSWILEKGDYIVLTGADSRNITACAALRLPEDKVVRGSQNYFGRTSENDWKNSTERQYSADGLKVIMLDPGKLADTRPEGRTEAGFEDVLEGLTDKELATLGVGAFDAKKILPSVIGDSGFTVPGAAGESANILEDKGIHRITMADGPAGVRIAREYYEDRKGKHSVQAAGLESMQEMMPAPMRILAGRKPKVPEGAKVFEQYCTAIPIATAIAQSFNTDFARICGDIVGTEMEMFGVDLWLAPALNIHRNVLCGRNFEYYSEDPVISGKFAAAITQGVQAHPGRGTTIKHFAANNQETNRYASNSVISERAIREIYLKGFGICIRESDPMALMTSYNLINGQHTSESRALTQEILRKEFGFDGLVMTDWVIGHEVMIVKGSKYTVPDAALVAAAGGSLFMPGRRKDLKEILDGIKKGKVSREQLIANAGWIMRVNERLGR